MKNIALTLLAAVTFWLFFAAFATGVATSTRSASSHVDSWVTQEKLRSLARYHGTDALKITEIEVFIWRDGDWVPVLKNEKI